MDLFISPLIKGRSLFQAENVEQIAQSNQFNDLDTHQEKSTSVSLHNNILHQFTVYVITHYKPFALRNKQFLPANPGKSGKKSFVITEWNFDVYHTLFVMEHHRKTNDEVTADKKTCRLEFF